ncbi:MAG: transcriptional regulator KorA [Bifidobacteriaceae bacterium]|jgi:hypothetical protein|nr:transcriptional regulator KorA [Bifidobacteriaceae bacterium]
MTVSPAVFSSGPIEGVLSREEALALTETIREATVVFFEAWANVDDAIQRAYQGRAWQVLGYLSWEAYCEAEFSEVKLFRTVQERQDCVARLVRAGLSIRAITAVLGVGRGTVERDQELLGVPTGTPNNEVEGRDGKRYPAKKLAREDQLARNIKMLDALAEGRTQSDVGSQFGVEQGRVSQVKREMQEYVAPLDAAVQERAEAVLNDTTLPPEDRAALFADLVGLQLTTASSDLAEMEVKGGVRDAVEVLRLVFEPFEQGRMDQLSFTRLLREVAGDVFKVYALATELWAVTGRVDEPLDGESMARYRAAIGRAHQAFLEAPEAGC